MLSSYSEPIFYACLCFLPVAALLTLPFMVVQYRRYGSIPFLRVLVVYSFMLYMLCAFFLTMLPLPSVEAVRKTTTRSIQWKLFSTYVDAFRKAGFILSDPITLTDLTIWKRFFTSSGLFEILANIVMQIPLGVYLRYYFRCSWKKTLLIGFLVSLFYELTQLTGLWFIYPNSYRLCSVDDLFDNTLGAMIGYAIAPVLCSVLPTRDELDRQSIERDRGITMTRRVTAAVIDWVIFALLLLIPLFLLPREQFLKTALIGYFLWVLLVSVVLQRFTGGKTIGKALLKVALRDAYSQEAPRLSQLFRRYFTLYILAPLMICGAFLCLAMTGTLAASDLQSFRLLGIAGFIVVLSGNVLWLILTLNKHKEFPHSYWSHTRIIGYPPKEAPLKNDTLLEQEQSI